jgi:hypothetical protein
MANYRVSTNANNSSKNTTQDKANKKTTTKEITKQNKMDQLRLFTIKHDLLKISTDLQTAFAAETHLAEGQWLKEQLNVVKYAPSAIALPSGNTNADSLQDKGAIFSATKYIY